MSKLVRFIIYIILVGVFYLSSNYVLNQLNIFLDFTVYVLTIIFGIGLWYLLLNYNLSTVFFFYGLFVFTIMFFRKEITLTNKPYNFDFYLFRWLKLLDKKIVFFNIIGNLLIFIPLIIFLNRFFRKNILINVIICIMIITLLEWLQVITKKGIFDIVDIVLNVCGVVIGVILDVVCKGVKTWTKIHAEKKTIMMMNQKSKNY